MSICTYVIILISTQIAVRVQLAGGVLCKDTGSDTTAPINRRNKLETSVVFLIIKGMGISTTLFLGTIIIPAMLYWLYKIRSRKCFPKESKDTGLKTVPLIENFLLLSSSKDEIINKISDLTEKYGDYVQFRADTSLKIICVKNPKDIRHLLTSSKINKKGPGYRFMEPFLGKGLLTGGSSWRVNRKIFTPLYNKNSIQRYNSVFNREADELTNVLLQKDANETFDIFLDVLYATTQAVCQTLLGLSKEESINIRCLKEVMYETESLHALLTLKAIRSWFSIPIIYWLSGWRKVEDKIFKYFDVMTTDVLEKRRTVLETAPSKDSFSILDYHIFNGLNDTEIKQEISSLFCTSQDASAEIASAVLLALAHLPEWQEKVLNEIHEVIEEDEQIVTEEHIKKLKHLDMVYKEALRYVPIGPWLQRTVEEEISINNGKIILPLGTTVLIPIHTIHRDPKYWEEPNIFKPERFLPENILRRDSNVYIPFSIGAMDCLGRLFADALIKTLVIKVLQKLQLEADGKLEDKKLHFSILMHFENYKVRVRPRSTST